MPLSTAAVPSEQRRAGRYGLGRWSPRKKMGAMTDRETPGDAPPAGGSGLPDEVIFEDMLDWASPLAQVYLLVELPFWLMIDDCELELPLGPAQVAVWVHDQHREVYLGEVRDSRTTLVYRGPRPDLLHPDIVRIAEEQSLVLAERPSRTVVRLRASVHTDVILAMDGSEEPEAMPRRRREAEAYLASICEAHLSVVNDLIQRYRLSTYDYFAYEVSPWDVPVWTIAAASEAVTIRLLPYWDWDSKPVVVGPDHPGGADLPPRPFRFTEAATLLATVPAGATPGELELLDARSLMERGDYTGAVRRTATALEAVVGWALAAALREHYDEAEVQQRLAASMNDFPGRLRQWLKLTPVQVPKQLLDELEATRAIRHDIVHRARRLSAAERGVAQRCVDTGRWLFNFIEQKPDRREVREGAGALASAGRSALAPRFPVHLTSDGAVVVAFDGDSPAGEL